MPSINYVLLYCAQCRTARKIEPERVYENGAFEFPRLRALKCPSCKGPMKRVPEYGEPGLTHGVYPMSSDAEWMA